MQRVSKNAQRVSQGYKGLRQENLQRVSQGNTEECTEGKSRVRQENAYRVKHRVKQRIYRG